MSKVRIKDNDNKNYAMRLIKLERSIPRQIILQTDQYQLFVFGKFLIWCILILS